MSEIFIPLKDRNPTTDDWNDYTVLIPSVSVGNVPQLTIDLLISTLIDSNDCQLCGHIYSSALMPLSGPDPYRFGGQVLATSSQVFESVKRKLIIIQQRTPVYKELRKDFYKSLTEWLSRYKFKRIVILTSSFVQHLVSALGSGDSYPFKYLTNSVKNSDENQLKETLKWETVDKVDQFTLEPSQEGVIHLPGSGFTQSLLKHLDNSNIPAIALIMYCSEGDNRPHAFAFADRINQWIKLLDENNKSWIIPYSWRMFYGEDAPQSIY